MIDYSLLNGLNAAKRLNSGDKQMLFQERMSNSAHTREVEDLKNAGLNPVLSAGGEGASTPSGSSEGSSADNPIGQLVGAVNKLANTSAQSLSKAMDILDDESKKDSNKMNNIALSIMKDALDPNNHIYTASAKDKKLGMTFEDRIDSFMNRYKLGDDGKIKFEGKFSQLPNSIKKALTAFGYENNVDVAKVMKDADILTPDIIRSLSPLNTKSFGAEYTKLYNKTLKTIKTRIKRAIHPVSPHSQSSYTSAKKKRKHQKLTLKNGTTGGAGNTLPRITLNPYFNG